MPEAATALFGRTIKIFHSQLEKRLRDYVQGTLRTTCWPSLGQLLLLQFLGSLYSVTDFRNSIVISITMFLCQCLAQCPIASLQDASHATLCCSILLGYTTETKRFIPEVVTTVCTLLSIYTPASANPLRNWIKTISSESLRKWVVESNRHAAVSLESKLVGTAWSNLRWEYFSDAVGSRVFTAKDNSINEIIELYPYASLALFHLLAVMVRDCHKRFSGVPCYSEIMGPVSAVLDSVVTSVFPTELQSSLDKLCKSVEDGIVSCRSSRKPLMWREKKVVAIQSLAPRYEVNYNMKKDLDVDRGRVQLKQLKRQVKREHKAAMRELRRDSDFLSQEAYKSKQAIFEQKKAERHANFAWMEQEQDIINQQVRKGGEMLRGGGSGATKPLLRAKRSKRK